MALATAVIFFNSQCVLPLGVALAQGTPPKAKPTADAGRSAGFSAGRARAFKDAGGNDSPAKRRAAKTSPATTAAQRVLRQSQARVRLAQNLERGKSAPTTPIAPPTHAPGETLGVDLCCSQPISVAPLDLSKVPTEAQIKAAGGMAGPLDTLGNADEKDFKERLTRQFGLASVEDFDRISIAANMQVAARGAAAPPGLQLLAKARKRVLRLESINHEFGLAINERNARHFPRTALLMQEHLDKFPDSPWAGEAMLHLAMDASHTGRPAEAQARLQALLDITVEDPADTTWEIRCKAKGTWADLDLQLGQYESALPKLKNMLENDTSSHRRSWASMWLTQARLRLGAKAEPGFRLMSACGSEALGLILVGLNMKSAAQRVEKIVPPHRDGFSLEEIARISARNGVPMKGFRVKSGMPAGARASQLAQLPLPLILHYDMARYGHTAAAQGRPAFGLARGAAAQAFAVSASPSTSASASTAAQTVAPHCPDCPPVRAGAKKIVHTATSKAFQVRSIGHFLVVRAIDKARATVTLDDPLLHSTYKLSFAQLEKEWSGFGLMLERSPESQKSAPKSFKAVPPAADVRVAGINAGANTATNAAPQRFSALAREGIEGIELLDRVAMTRIRGGCCCSWIFGPSGPPTENYPPPAIDPDCVKGSPSLQVNPISMGTYIKDIPVWYDTPIGPDVEPMLSYNSQDGLLLPAFGNRWRLNYESFITENPGGAAYVNEGTGAFTTYRQSATGGYVPPTGVFNSLTKTGDNRFEITTPTGEKKVYDKPRGVDNAILDIPVVALQEVRDRFGAALQMRYTLMTRVIADSTFTSVRLVRLIDAQGKVTVFQYDSNQRCTAIVITNTTTGDVNSPTARRATFGYNSNGNLTNVEDMGGNPFSYTYDTDAIVTSVGTEQGAWTLSHRYPGHNPFTQSYEYNNETTVTDPQGGTQVYGMYMQIGGPFSGEAKFVHTDANGNQTMNGYGAPIGGVLHLTTEEGPGYVVLNSRTYDPATGKVNSVTDENGDTTSATYNSRGLPLSMTTAMGQTTQFIYDPTGTDLLQVKNNRGNTVMSATYNANHQPSSVTVYPTATQTPAYTTNFTYSAWGAPQTTTIASSETTTYNYDATTKRLMSIAVASSTLASTTVAMADYDELGRVRTATDAYGLARTYEYNDLDKPVKVSYPDGSNEITDYVCCAIPGVSIDRSGRKTYRDYDELQRLRRVQDADGNTLQMDYDKVGNLVRLIDGRGSVTRWDYDKKDRPIRKTYADGSREGYAYDGTGQLIRTYDARGAVTKYAYDADGKQLGVDYPNVGGWTVDTGFSYDDLGRLSAMSDRNGTTTWSYDNLGRVLGEDGPWSDDAVTYSYDEQGRRKTLGVNGGNTSTYNYDSLGRLDTLVAGAGTWNWDYVGGSGLLALLAAPNGTRTSYSYDGLERMTGVSNRKSDATTILSQYVYGFDNTNKKDARWSLTRQSRDTSQTLGASQVLSFGYNATDQLTGETSGESNPLTKLTRTYDAMGNWQSRTDQGRDTATTGLRNLSQTYTHNRLNQMTGIATTYTDASTGAASISYDSRGNVAQSSDTKSASYVQYRFDDESRLFQILTRRASDSVVLSQTTFFYDGFGRKKWVLEQEVVNNNYLNKRELYLTYDGMDVVREREHVYATAGNPATITTSVQQLTRVGNIGGILARTKQVGGQTDRHSFYSYDGTGNVTTITDASQNVQCAYAYSGFGLEKVQEAVGWEQPYRYSTKWQHQSGLIDYGFRFYNPNWGRWINRDPIAEGGGVNLYAMVGNNPTNYGDDYGHGRVKLVKLVASGFKKIVNLSDEAAVKAIQDGEDIAAEPGKLSKLMKEAGVNDPIRDTPADFNSHLHKPNRDPGHFFDESRSDRKFNPKASEVKRARRDSARNRFRDNAAALTVPAYTQDQHPMVQAGAEVLDFFNPLSLPADIADITDLVSPEGDNPCP
jgi:RHS repeat-associated protein